MNTGEALGILGFDTDDVGTLDLVVLKKNYRSRAKLLHPDKHSGSKDKFVELGKAYTLLKTLLEQIDKHSSQNSVYDDHNGPQDKKSSTDRGGISSEKDADGADDLTREIEKKDKNEIIKKYIQAEKSLIIHRQVIESQEENLAQTEQTIRELTADYQNKQNILKEELDKILSDLQKKYNLGWLGNLFLFLPSNRQVEFEERAARIRAKYESIKESLEASLYREITQVYGISLNQIKSSHKIDSVQIKK